MLSHFIFAGVRYFHSYWLVQYEVTHLIYVPREPNLCTQDLISDSDVRIAFSYEFVANILVVNWLCQRQNMLNINVIVLFM
jgi:hypothetical protein